MLKQLEVNIRKNALFDKEHKLLLAFSGGVDSVVLAHLLHEGGYAISLAHCNFQLRGQEAASDAMFAAQHAESLNANFFLTHFDTAHYAKEHGLSIQMAARELRYSWFEELVSMHGFDRIVTAHHAGDQVETILVNLVRGTGIKGMQGIPLKQKNIVRPLLFATREEILAYARERQLHYQEDSSNAEVKYKRNFIRHRVIPELKALNPSLEETFSTSSRFFSQSSAIVSAYAKEKFNSLCQEKNGQLLISRNGLTQEAYRDTLLFEWLYEKGFKPRQIGQLSEVLEAEAHSGKQFSSSTHELVVDRQYVIVRARDRANSATSYTIASPDDTRHLPIALTCSELTKADFSADPREVVIPYTDDLFPLRLRHWQEGDKFRPFGMKGSKKLSDLFKDQKLSLFDKQAVWILENREHILWVVGYRLDERCRIQDHRQRLLKIRVS